MLLLIFSLCLIVILERGLHGCKVLRARIREVQVVSVFLFLKLLHSSPEVHRIAKLLSHVLNLQVGCCHSRASARELIVRVLLLGSWVAGGDHKGFLLSRVVLLVIDTRNAHYALVSLSLPRVARLIIICFCPLRSLVQLFLSLANRFLFLGR